MTQEVLTALGATAPAGAGDPGNPVGPSIARPGTEAEAANPVGPSIARPGTPANDRPADDQWSSLRPGTKGNARPGGDQWSSLRPGTAADDRQTDDRWSSLRGPGLYPPAKAEAANPVGPSIARPGTPANDRPTDDQWSSLRPGTKGNDRPTDDRWSSLRPGTAANDRPTDDQWSSLRPETKYSAFRIPNSEFLRAHFDALCAQGEALRAEDPSFDLDAALRDPDFLRLTAPGMGVDVRRAWTALHPEELQRRAAAASAGMLARSLSSTAARPREGGGQGGVTLETDYRRLPRAEQQRLKRRIYDAAALGEKIYP